MVFNIHYMTYGLASVILAICRYIAFAKREQENYTELVKDKLNNLILE